MTCQQHRVIQASCPEEPEDWHEEERVQRASYASPSPTKHQVLQSAESGRSGVTRRYMSSTPFPTLVTVAEDDAVGDFESLPVLVRLEEGAGGESVEQAKAESYQECCRELWHALLRRFDALGTARGRAARSSTRSQGPNAELASARPSKSGKGWSTSDQITYEIIS